MKVLAKNGWEKPRRLRQPSLGSGCSLSARDWPLGVMRKDAGGKWRQVNRHARRLLGMDEQLSLEALSDPDWLQQHPDFCQALAQIAASDTYVWQNKQKAREYIRLQNPPSTLAVTKLAVSAARGAPQCLLIVLKAVLPNSMDSSRQSRMLQFALDQARTAIWCKDGEQRILWANRAASNLLGRDSRDIVGHQEEVMVQRELLSCNETDDPKLQSHLRPPPSLEQWILPNGQVLTVEVDRVPYHGSSTIVYVRDMTEREKREDKLRADEERYRTIVNEIKDGYFETDLAGNLTFFNPALTEILGYPEDEMYGLNDRQYTDEDNAKALYHAFNQVFRTGQPVAAEWQIIRKDQARRYLDASVSLVKNEAGDPVGFRGIARDITDRKTMELQLHYLAHHDILTNLPNRSVVVEYLNSAIMAAAAQDMMAAVFFIDLDRFKYVNDTMGHVAGDQMLKAVAQRLQAALRKEALVARMGGDEFIIVLPLVTAIPEVNTVAQRVLDRLGQPWEVGGKVFLCPGSIGIAIYPDDGANPDTLLKHADIAMYRAKGRGGNGYVLYRSG